MGDSRRGKACANNGFGLLGGGNEELSVLDRGLGKDTMAEVEDVAGLAEGGDEFGGGLADLRWRAEEDGRIEVALQGNARAELAAESGEIDTPVDAEDVGARAGDGGEKVVGGFGVVDDRGLRCGRVQGLDDLLGGGKGELGVFGERKFATPSVEELDG